ncbi:MAG: hypothetical protein SO389_06005 [Eubacterium sp.]|nr:hypothetical protein [Eubacterium sp.]
MNYFDKIRSLNNLQLCHFLKQIDGNLELVALALDQASNPQIYCSDDNFCVGTPPNKSERYYDSTLYWHRCLSKDFDERMDKIFENDKEIREQIRGWKEKEQDNENR